MIRDTQSAVNAYSGMQKFIGKLNESISKRADNNTNPIKAVNNQTVAINNASEDERTEKTPDNETVEKQTPNTTVSAQGMAAPGQIIDFRA